MEIAGKVGRVISYQEDFYSIEKAIKGFLRELNAASDYQVFGYRERALFLREYEDLKRLPPVFTGSFATLYPVVPYVKRDVGDVDLILPYDTEPYAQAFLMKEGIPFRSIGTQIHFIHPKLGIQVDLEFKEYFDHLPSEFSVFSNSLSETDVSHSIKGAFTKMLIMSLTSANNEKYCFSVSHGIRERNHEADKNPRAHSIRDMETIFGRLFVEPTGGDVSHHVKYSMESMKSFLGVYLWISQHFSPEQKTLVLDKFWKKVNEKPREPQDVEALKRLMESVPS